jgi:hypothetical protein
MKKILVLCIAFIAIAFLSLQSCKKNDDNGCGNTNISASGGTKSHNAGVNCMNCHYDGGGGDGCFTVAGTVYNSSETSIYPDATIKLYTQPEGAGQLVATIYGDAYGNFFTTDGVDFTGGLYPVMSGTNGEYEGMYQGITTGACNSCHGISTGKLHFSSKMQVKS